MSEPDPRTSTDSGPHPAAARPGAGPTVVAPPPGRAVLACRCGRVLSLADMQRPDRSQPRSRGAVDAICCGHCAANSAW